MYQYLVITEGSIRYWPYNHLEDEETMLSIFDKLKVNTFSYFDSTKTAKKIYVIKKVSDSSFEIEIRKGTPDFILKLKTILSEFNDMLELISEEELNLIFESPNDVNWEEISFLKTALPEQFIRTFANKLDWNIISRDKLLSEGFIREFQDKVNWSNISGCQTLSESFIREFKDKVNWTEISKCQKLSENIIAEFSDKVDWQSVSLYQTLSESFIEEFSDKINWQFVSKHQKLSEEFIDKLEEKLREC